MKRIALSILFFFATADGASAQFAPQAGLQGSTAIHKDNTMFVEWASGCAVERGYMDIAVPDSGYANLGDTSSAIGKAGENGIVSLGDGGTATLTFQYPIYNGAGYDFAVFENGFGTGDSALAFLEFAFVEVSSDGNNFFRFAATSHIQDTAQLPMTGVDCSLVNNLAGKYVSGYGTPFDLEELKNEIGLDVNNITHIRLTDVVGSISSQYATYDQYGTKINDPYPTPFPSSGFDLDAVGVIHAVGVSGIEGFRISNSGFRIYPNPSFQKDVFLNVDETLLGSNYKIYDAVGKLIAESCITSANCKLQTANWLPGIYFVRIGNRTAKLVVE